MQIKIAIKGVILAMRLSILNILGYKRCLP